MKDLKPMFLKFICRKRKLTDLQPSYPLVGLRALKLTHATEMVDLELLQLLGL